VLNVLSYINGKRKTNSSGWVSFDALCCVHNGETQDRKQRGGLKFSNDTDWSYHCFNCGYTASFTLGYPVSYKAQRLLKWMGVPEIEVQRLTLESLKHKDVNQLLRERREQEPQINFPTINLPETARLIEETDTLEFAYLRNRGVDPWSYPYMIDEAQTRSGILIPYTYDNKVVGWTTRFLDDRKPKYLNNCSAAGYVFGTDLQHDDWQIAIAVEGQFDALSIDGVAITTNRISDTQAAVLRRLNREIVVVPDQDRAGLELVADAVKYGFSVSIPEWDADVKDVNDAVRRYGKLATLISIINNKNSSKIKIELAKKALERRI
jgi:hypothetical protein